MGLENSGESIGTKISREFDLAAAGADGFGAAAASAWSDHKLGTLAEAGTAAALGLGIGLIRRIPGVGLPVGAAIAAGLTISSLKNLAENGLDVASAVADNWRSGTNWQSNQEVVRRDVGQYAFDSAVTVAAGGLTAGLSRGLTGRTLATAAGAESKAPVLGLTSGKTGKGPAQEAWALSGPALIAPKIDLESAVPHPEVLKAMTYQKQTSGNSPWLHTVEGLRPLPQLVGHVDADVTVIGSGVVGQQIALRLALMGKSVVNLEANRAGSGTSEMMGAMNTLFPDPGFGLLLNKLGPERFANVIQRMISGRGSVEQLGRMFGDFRPVNTYMVAYDESNADVLAEANLLRKFDPSVRFLNGREAEAIFPLARSAAIIPGEGNLNPLKMLNGMARSGRYRVFEDSPVLAIAPTTDGALVYTPAGRVHAREKVIVATNTPVAPFGDANNHLTPVQTFSNIANIGRDMPGNYFDSPDQSGGKVPFSYWRQFGLPQFAADETLVGGTAHFLPDDKAVPFEPQLPEITAKLFAGAQGRKQSTALIWTDYDWGLPLYYRHPQYSALSTALGGGGNGLNAGALLAQAAAIEARGGQDLLLTPGRGMGQ